MTDLNAFLDWDDRLSPALSFAGQQFPGLVDMAFDVLRAIRGVDIGFTPRGGEYLDELLVFPGADVWDSYYRDPRKLLRDFCFAFLKATGVEDSEIDAAIAQMPDAASLREGVEAFFSGMSREDDGVLSEGGEEVLAGLRSFIDVATTDLHDQIANKTDPHRKEDILAFVRNPAVKFMARTFAPCVASYQVLPGDLLEKAVNGDKKALESLLTLDKHALALPAVAAMYHEQTATDFEGFRDTMLEYLKKPPPMPTKSGLKQEAGASFWLLFTNLVKQLLLADDAAMVEKFKKPNSLTMKEVLEFFAKHEQAAGRLKPYQPDPDIGDGGTFKKAVSRVRAAFTSLLGRIMPLAAKPSASASSTRKTPESDK